jgi:hypothetical protein
MEILISLVTVTPVPENTGDNETFLFIAIRVENFIIFNRSKGKVD